MVLAPQGTFQTPSPGRVDRHTLIQPLSVSVKLDPPSDLQSNVSSGSYVLTWSINPALEPLASLLSYELAFKRQEEAWEVMLGLATLGSLSLLGAAAQGHSSSHMRRGGDQSQEYVSNVHVCLFMQICLCECACA